MAKVGWFTYLLPFVLLAAILVRRTPLFSDETLGRPLADSDVALTRVPLSFGMTRYTIRTPASSSGSSSKAPLVVMCHGFSASSDFLGPIAEQVVAEGYRVLTWDLYGRGFSESAAVPHTTELFTSQLAELLFVLRLGQDEPFTLLGVSMGGVIAARFAELHSMSVGRLVFVSSAGLPVSKPLLAHLTALPFIGELGMGLLGSKQVKKHFQDMWVRPDSEVAKYLETKFHAAVDRNPALLRSLLSTLRNVPLGEAEATFRAIADHPRPVLLVWGDKDNVCPYSNALKMRSIFSHSELVTVYGARHALTAEFPQQLGGAIVDFLRKHAAVPSCVAADGGSCDA